MKLPLLLVFALIVSPVCGDALSPLIIESYSPKSMLDLLKKSKTPVFYQKICKNWLKPEDVVWLLRLLDSTEPCASIHSTYSSHLPAKRSTVGQEAAFMILGYIKAEYPPTLNSDEGALEAKQEVERWLIKQISPLQLNPTLPQQRKDGSGGKIPAETSK
jgi:hypothetical protein